MTSVQERAEKLLVSLDDSNTVSSYKNEDAAAMIRELLGEIEHQRRVNRSAELQTQEYEERIAATVEYLRKRSWSNGVIPKALTLLGEDLDSDQR